MISIPGTLGSRLVEKDTGVVMWGGADGLSVDPEEADNPRLIALPIGEGDGCLGRGTMVVCEARGVAAARNTHRPRSPRRVLGHAA